eukprot:TRINITY_DN3586_c0_g1_i2.p1 TRINITY_DN3586_c0_g1~~TRINITY_DN3586_c0_g1_i2.p1  ORF type:complete len:311 (-),score=48.01 TRINITY_DN3586_c0_g1_i2:55-987(-)
MDESGFSTVLPFPAQSNAPSQSFGNNVENNIANAEPGNNAGPPLKRKRGRPRKYGPDGTMALALASMASVSSSASSSKKQRGRGRPPGSTNVAKKQQLSALGSPGFGFIPIVITINPGEDVAAKIRSLSEHGPRSFYIMSASGLISNATFRKSNSPEEVTPYEGQFTLLTMTCPLLSPAMRGEPSKLINIAVSLSTQDGRVIAGSVVMLIAASPVQVVVGSFILESTKNEDRPKNVSSFVDLPASNMYSTVNYVIPGQFNSTQDMNMLSLSNANQASDPNMEGFQSMSWPVPQTLGVQNTANFGNNALRR